MRFHVVSLPHTQTTVEYVMCAYTQKVRKFCKMMMDRGHEVFLYSSEENDAPCTEHINCRFVLTGTSDYINAPWDPETPMWSAFNARAIIEITKRVQPQDFICLIGGRAHKPIADAFPHHMSVEFGIGYSGTFAKFRVWESYAWMHTVYGAQAKEPMTTKGFDFDAVIPNYFDAADFPYSGVKDDYYLYLGRLTQLKGVIIASQVCQRLGKKLIIAGNGDHRPVYGEYVGPVGFEERGKLLSRAAAVFVPTQYLEPFGGVAVEAMMCGTPVITSDFGAFTETVQQGVTGFRCRMFQEYCDAADKVRRLKPHKIANYARDRYSLKPIGAKYEQYFERLLTLWEKGWYADGRR